MNTTSLHATPLFWSEKREIYEQCGSAHPITVSFDTQSRAKSTFTIEIYIDTSFKPISLVGPISHVIHLPERCGKIYARLKSHSVGQIVKCIVKRGM